MSIRLMDAALDLPLDSTSKLVLVVLADHANNDGDGIYPGNKRIARRASLSVRQTQRCLSHLEGHDLIVRARYAAGGRGMAVDWSINPTVVATHKTMTSVSPFVGKGDICDIKGCHLRQETMTWASPQPSGTIMNRGDCELPDLPERREGESMGEWLDRIAEENTT